MYNSTLLIPEISDAETKILTLPFTLESGVGLDMVTTGSVVSCTVTVNEAVPVLPAASLAVHVTVVIPIANVEPEAGVQVGPLVTPMLSVAVTAYVTTAPEELVDCTVMFDGTVIVGGVVSVAIVNVEVADAAFPEVSVAFATMV